MAKQRRAKETSVLVGGESCASRHDRRAMRTHLERLCCRLRALSPPVCLPQPAPNGVVSRGQAEYLGSQCCVLALERFRLRGPPS